MSHQLEQAQRPTTVWVLVADAAQAQIYKYHKTSRLSPLGGGNKNHYYNEKTGYELLPVESTPEGAADFNHKQHDVKSLAAQLGRAHAHKAYDRLVLVAPAKMVGDLREQLSSEVRHTVAAELHKDLTHCHGKELLDHLQEHLNTACVA